MNEDFEDQLRLAIRHDEVEIAADTDAAIRDGRRIVRGRRLGWGVAACTVVAAAALLLPGLAQRGVPAVPVQPGATTSASPASGVLAGTEWNAVKLEGAALRPGTSITLRFGDGWVDGFGGCNNFGYTTADGEIEAGAYHQDGDRLTIAPVATTEKGCANGVSDQEGRFLQALPRVDHFLISSGGLVLQLLGADGGLLVQFEPAAPKLERTGWTVTAIKGAPPVPGTRPPSLVFLNGCAVRLRRLQRDRRHLLRDGRDHRDRQHLEAVQRRGDQHPGRQRQGSARGGVARHGAGRPAQPARQGWDAVAPGHLGPCPRAGCRGRHLAAGHQGRRLGQRQRLGHHAEGRTTRRCRGRPAVPSTPPASSTPGTPGPSPSPRCRILTRARTPCRPSPSASSGCCRGDDGPGRQRTNSVWSRRTRRSSFSRK